MEAWSVFIVLSNQGKLGYTWDNRGIACVCVCVCVWVCVGVWVCGATNDLLHFRCSVIHSTVNYKYELVCNPKYARGECERHEASVELPSPVALPGV